MEVEVRLFGGFREGRFRKETLDLSEGTSLRDLLQQLDIPEDQVTVPLINGRNAEFDTKLTAKDVVSFMPAIAGG